MSWSGGGGLLPESRIGVKKKDPVFYRKGWEFEMTLKWKNSVQKKFGFGKFCT